MILLTDFSIIFENIGQRIFNELFDISVVLITTFYTYMLVATVATRLLATNVAELLNFIVLHLSAQ